MNESEPVGVALRELRAVATGIHKMPTRDYERATRDELDTAIVSPLAEHLERGLDACTALFTEYLDLTRQADADTRGADISRTLDALFASEDPAAHVADVMFMACWELKQKLAALQDSAACDAHELYCRCCSARRRAVKVLCAAEMVVCDLESLSSELAPLYRTELQTALAVRRAFAEFRVGVAQVSITHSAPKGRVRGIGIVLAKLVGSEGYLYTRADDRMRIRALQERALVWLRDPHADPSGADEVSAEASALVDTLRGVNERVELIEHDRRLAEQVFALLFGDPPRPLLNEALLSQLEPLRGRDDEIDGLLSLGVQPADPWRELLQRLRDAPVEPSFSTSRKIYLRQTRS